MNAIQPTLMPHPDKNLAYESCRELRFAEGLRRRSPEARAEAAIQEAVGVAWLEGARVDAADLRAVTMALSGPQGAASFTWGVGKTDSDLGEVSDPALAQALGVWRALWRVLGDLPALNSRQPLPRGNVPVPGVLAGVNRDVSSFLVASGFLDSGEVALPRKPQAVAHIMRILANRSVDAIDRAGRVWEILMSEKIFSAGNTSTSIVFVKWLLATEGVEPTGVSVLSRWGVEERARFQSGLEGGFGSDVVVRSLIRGCQEGAALVRTIQAGTPG